MTLTPHDVQDRTFRTGWRGYEPEDVHHFLRLVAEHMQSQADSMAQLHTEAQQSARELLEHRQRERDLRDAMVSAQRAIDTIRQQAQRDAEAVVQESKLQAERVLQQAHGRLHGMVEELHALKRQRVQMIEELRAVLNTHHKLLALHENMDAEREEMGASLSMASPLSHVPMPSMHGLTPSAPSLSASTTAVVAPFSTTLADDDDLDLEIDLTQEAVPDVGSDLLRELHELKRAAGGML